MPTSVKARITVYLFVWEDVSDDAVFWNPNP